MLLLLLLPTTEYCLVNQEEVLILYSSHVLLLGNEAGSPPCAAGRVIERSIFKQFSPLVISSHCICTPDFAREYHSILLPRIKDIVSGSTFSDFLHVLGNGIYFVYNQRNKE